MRLVKGTNLFRSVWVAALAVVSAAIVALLPIPAPAAQISVAVFDADKVGGQSCGETGLMQTLAGLPGYEVKAIADLTASALASRRVLILPDVHKVGQIGPGCEATIRSFVEKGGGVLLTHDCPGLSPEKLFPELLGGTERHVERRVDRFSTHALTFGLRPFDHAYGDDRDVRAAAKGEVVLQCSSGRPVAVAGAHGQGRVLHLGLVFGLGGRGGEEKLEGEELRLLQNAIVWLGGGAPWTDAKTPLVRLWAEKASLGQPEPIVIGIALCHAGDRTGADLHFTMADAAGNAVAQGQWRISGEKSPAAHYARHVQAASIKTEALKDDTYTISVSEKGICPDTVTVKLEGRLRAADRERTGEMTRLHRDSVIKFEFNQGYEYRKDESKLAPFMKRLREQGCTAYDCHAAGYLWNEDAFKWLASICPAAAAEGLKVWATLVPPSEKEELRRMPRQEAYQYFYDTVERFARMSLRHPNFVGYTCDDFSNDLGFFTPEVVAEMVGRQRKIAPKLAFMPLLYWPGITESVRERYGPYVDGIVFHFRAESYPPSYLEGYDPKNFDMYGDVMRYEFKRVRQIMGDKPVLAGIYIWYSKGGWGVNTPDGKNPTEEHVVRDAVQKALIAHDYADGVRIYGLGIDHAAYTAMGEHFRRWQQSGEHWGQKRGEPKEHLGRSANRLGNPPYLGTLLNRPTACSEGSAKASGWPRVELIGRFRDGQFESAQAAKDFPLIAVSRSMLRREWPDNLLTYAQAGGILLLEEAPGWQLDPPREGEKAAGDECPLTLKFAQASGVVFRYEPRGFVTRYRVVAQHPLTEGLSPVGEWVTIPFGAKDSTYSRLAYNVKADRATVLIEAEQERCPYDGVHYVRKGDILGIRPLLTVNAYGQGMIVRHYAHASAPAVFGEEAFQRLAANLVRWALGPAGTRKANGA